MRPTASILHLDMDAFFAAIEQRDKPSLRGKPVVVGGTGVRGVVSTASYEARRFGVRSAMSIAQARSRCPHAAYLGARFDEYRRTSAIVMGLLHEVSPLVEPLSVDEAFVDLAAAEGFSASAVPDLVASLRAEVTQRTGGLTCSIGVASSKFMAKIASEINKPDGFHLVAPGTEMALIGPMPVTAIVGVGPATAERLRTLGVSTVEDLRGLSEAELVRLLGAAGGTNLHRLARAEDDRPVVADRESKSVSVEDTFDHDIADRARLESIVDAMARTVARRLRTAKLSGRTITVKIRRHDFETSTRSMTLRAPTDHPGTITEAARSLLAATDVTDGLRLVGVGVSGLADWVQEDLFGDDTEATDESATSDASEVESFRRPRGWTPGLDVRHEVHGDGWVWGSGLGRVTVRFETRQSPAGPIHTFRADDPQLRPRPVESTESVLAGSEDDAESAEVGSPATVDP